MRSIDDRAGSRKFFIRFPLEECLNMIRPSLWSTGSVTISSAWDSMMPFPAETLALWDDVSFYETQSVNNPFSWLKLTIPFCPRHTEHYCRRFPRQFVYLERCKLYCKAIRWRSRKIQGPFIGYFKRSLSNASIVWVEWRWFNVSQIYFSPCTFSRRSNRQSDCSLSTTFNIAAARFGRPTFKVQILWRKVWRELPFMVFGCIKRFQ